MPKRPLRFTDPDIQAAYAEGDGELRGRWDELPDYTYLARLLSRVRRLRDSVLAIPDSRSPLEHAFMAEDAPEPVDDRITTDRTGIRHAGNPLP